MLRCMGEGAKVVVKGVQEARDNIREFIDSAIKDGDHLVITRHGKAVVAMVPIEWYEANGGEDWKTAVEPDGA